RLRVHHPRIVGDAAERREPEVPLEARLIRREDARRLFWILWLVAKWIGDPRRAVARSLKFDFVTCARHHREEAEAVDDACWRQKTRHRKVRKEKHRRRGDEVSREDDRGNSGREAPSPLRARHAVLAGQARA